MPAHKVKTPRDVAITLHLTQAEVKELEAYLATLPLAPANAKAAREFMLRGLRAAISQPELFVKPPKGQKTK